MMGLVFRWYCVGIRREEAACRFIGSALGRLEQQAEVVAVYEIGVAPRVNSGQGPWVSDAGLAGKGCCRCYSRV